MSEVTQEAQATQEKQEVKPWQLPELSGVAQHNDTSSSADATQTPEAAYEAGLKEGELIARQSLRDEIRAQIEQEYQEQLNFVKQINDYLKSPVQTIEAEVHQELLQLTLQLTEQICRKASSEDPQILLQIIREAISMIPEYLGAYQIKISASDYTRLTQMLSESDPLSSRIQSDESLETGDFRIQGDSADINGTLKNRIQNLIDKHTQHERT